MATKKSKVYKVDGLLFRYDYDRSVVEYVSKAGAQELKDNEEWMEKYGEPLWDIEDGYVVIDSIGLRKENWKNKESRIGYLEQWAAELRYEADCMAADFLKYEMGGTRNAVQ